MRAIRRVIPLLFALIVACGGSDDPAVSPLQCSLDDLSGTWRLHFAETNGTCGAIPDTTVTSGVADTTACTVKKDVVSPDKCREEFDLVCPTDDLLGTVEFVGVLTQRSESVVSGSTTVTVTHPEVTCRSTYDVSLTKL
jgi:hypothetical protein